MNKKFHINAKKAFMDYKVEISGETGIVGNRKKKRTDRLDYSKDEYTHLGRS